MHTSLFCTATISSSARNLAHASLKTAVNCLMSHSSHHPLFCAAAAFPLPLFFLLFFFLLFFPFGSLAVVAAAAAALESLSSPDSFLPLSSSLSSSFSSPSFLFESSSFFFSFSSFLLLLCLPSSAKLPLLYTASCLPGLPFPASTSIASSVKLPCYIPPAASQDFLFRLLLL